MYTQSAALELGAYCGFYEEQARYALRLIADKRDGDFLWEGWDAGTETVFGLGQG